MFSSAEFHLYTANSQCIETAWLIFIDTEAKAQATYQIVAT